MTRWMIRHKILSFIGILVLVTSCGAVLGEDSGTSETTASERRVTEADDGSPSASASATEDPAPSPSPSEEASPAAASPTEMAPTPEPTQRQVWAASFETSRAAYVGAVATALAVRPRNINVQAGYRTSCRLLGKERDLDRRVSQVQRAFALAGEPTYDQALGALGATTTTICPEFAAFHQAQTAERVERLRAEEQRIERERRAQERQARAAQQRAQQEAQQQENVFYDNCTAVEDAGAAPIYTGDPGYSRDLDRDGDGVACEQ